MGRSRFSANTVRTVGALLPSDVLEKILDSEGLEGLTPEAYGHDGVRLRDVVNDAWNELKPLWWGLQRELKTLPETDLAATALTRDKWLLPLLKALGFDGLETQHRAIDINGTAYPISHTYNHSPIHLMGARTELDTRIAGIPGAAKLSPHSLVQQFLNRSDDHLWGIVTNGNKLRLLRDSVSLTRQAFVEFDLAAMFNGEVYTDFNLLYRTIHATRFNGERPEHALLETWIKAAREDGTRARDQLRDGVQTAIETLGTGFLAHPNNDTLRQSITNGDTTEADLYKHLLRLIYRLLFLFVAEDRDLLHPEHTTPETRDRYTRYYSATRLRDLSTKPTATQHDDLWHSLTALMDALAKDEGEPQLGLPGLGSFLWQHDTIGQLRNTSLTNHHLLTAISHLSHTQQDNTNRKIDYTQLGAEELGSIYESLLELHPKLTSDCRSFSLEGGAGSERKTTGSYYTPAELISELLDTALDPVLDRAALAEDPEAAILDLKIVDPACGSGHFLLAAANRVAKQLAEIRTGEPEPPTEDHRAALRSVVSRCIFAVDMNDLAVELCKVSLWIETLEPGKPLSFLDHHILVGNSLFGATPASIDAGIPDKAFTQLTGDDKAIVSSLKKQNKAERGSGQGPLAFGSAQSAALAAEINALEDFEDDDLETVHAKEAILADWMASERFAHAKLVADSWCAAFAISKTAYDPALTDGTFARVRDEGVIDPQLATAVEQLAERYGFLHWHLAFPQVFRARTNESSNEAGWAGGFDVVLGNPPWDQVQYDPRETFAVSNPEIASASTTAKRNKLISVLEKDKPAQFRRYLEDVRALEGFKHFAHASGVFPLSSVGRLNTAPLFVERMWSILDTAGRLGVVTPTGIATDSFTQGFFNAMVERRALVSLYDFENRKKLFPGVHSSYKFCLLTLTGDDVPATEAQFVFFAHDPIELTDPDRRFALTAEDFALLNPNTRTCPVFRTQRDAEITKAIYRRVPVLVDETRPDGNPWGASFQLMFMMNTDSHLFQTKEGLENDDWSLDGNIFSKGSKQYLPLYEGKMIHQFDHRWATFDNGEFRDSTIAEKQNPHFTAMPRYWVSSERVTAKAGNSEWSVGWRDIARSTDARTLISAVVPKAAFGNKLPLMRGVEAGRGSMPALLNSVVVDFCVRQKVGGATMNFFYVKQFPVATPVSFQSFSPDNHVLELTYTSHDLVSFARDIGYDGEPFAWDSERRLAIRAELDAFALKRYGVSRADLAYVFESFPIIRRQEISEHGDYRSKDLALDAYDRMTAAEDADVPYETQIDPPPADPSLAHPAGASY